MGYPSFEEYTDALRLPPGAIFQDPLLAAGSVRRSAAGVPFARSGNFALTYEVTANGARYAVRCFHKEADSLERRYHAIGRKLRAIASPYFVDFEFQPAGIRTESGQYPIVRMTWAEGRSLAQFISEHRDDPRTLFALRDTLRDLGRHLEANDIGHGDIQPGNIVVRSATDLKLIDYDGMYVPELEPWGSTELGQRNFQHPGRSWLHYDERLDRFSFALLDVLLEALAMQPALWELTDSDEAGIVLRASDFADPPASTAFGVLAELDGVAVRARHLAALCQSPFERVPALDDFLAGRRIPAVQATLSSHSSGPPPYIPAYPVVDASNFARCCAHIGDRVELIGRVRRIVCETVPQAAAGAHRVEFGDAREDMIRLAIWPDAARTAVSGLETGQWLSAIGLVDPILTETNGGAPYKSVSIAITEPSQLRLLTEAEAVRRLAFDAVPDFASHDVAVTIGTDPAMPGAFSRPEPSAGPVAAASADRAPATPAADERAPGAPAPRAPAAMPQLATAASVPALTRVRAAPAPAPLSPPPSPTLVATRPAPVAAASRRVKRLIDWPARLRTARARSRAALSAAGRNLRRSIPDTARLRQSSRAALSAAREILRSSIPNAARLRHSLRDLTAANPLPHLRAALSRLPLPAAAMPRLRGVHPAWWLAMALLVVVLVQSWIIARMPDAATNIVDATRRVPPEPASRPARTDASRTLAARPDASQRSQARPAAPTQSALKSAVTTAGGRPISRLLAFEDLRSAPLPISTIAGPINVATRVGPPRVSLVTVNGAPLDESRAEINVLAYRSVYSDREVIVGFSDCTGSARTCERKEPFWLLLRKAAPPVLKRSPGLRANQSAGTVTAVPSGVHVDLGLWDGLRHTATLTSLDDVYVTRVAERPAPLSDADCGSVAAALESCAASRACGSYEAIIGSVPPARLSAVQRLFHETTGLDAAMFRSVCVRSCELGLTPTNTLVRREVCDGAPPGQWSAVSLGGS